MNTIQTEHEMVLTNLMSSFDIDEMATRTAEECKRTDLENLRDTGAGEVTMQRAINKTMRQLGDEAKWRYDSAKTFAEQDKWREVDVQQAAEMITRNADQRKPAANPISNSIINYDTELIQIAREVKKRAHDIADELNNETIRIRRRILIWGQREVNIPSEDEARSNVSERLAADRAKLASKAMTDPVDKNEAKRQLDAAMDAEKAQEERKTQNMKECPSKSASP